MSWIATDNFTIRLMLDDEYAVVKKGDFDKVLFKGKASGVVNKKMYDMQDEYNKEHNIYNISLLD